MKPLGLQFTMDGSLTTLKPTAVQDAIWDAVSKAIDAGWLPEQFKIEAAECWSEYLRQKRVDDSKAWRKP